MLSFWRQTSDIETKAFCELHAQVSGEFIEPRKAALYVFHESPYDGYQVVRLHIEPQTIRRYTGNVPVVAKKFTYALLALETSGRPYKIIPIHQAGRDGYHNIFSINAVLGLRVTAENAVKYMAFFGYAILTPPFYFIDDIENLDNLLSTLSEGERDAVTHSIRAVLGVDPDGLVHIRVRAKHYPVLGSTYTFEAPCLFQGDLYLSEVRVSGDGRSEMVEDRRLNNSGIYDPDDNLQYYALAPGQDLNNALWQATYRSGRLLRSFQSVIAVDSLLLAWVLPLFVFNVFVVLSIGLHDSTVVDYFQHLRISTSLSIVSLLLGLFGVILAVFRYAFFEALVYLKEAVPGVWTSAANQAEEEFRGITSRLGVPAFLIFSAVEHFAKTLMCVTLLLYGCCQFWPSLLKLELNFGQALTTVLAALPLVGSFIESSLAGTLFAPVKLPSLAANATELVLNFLISTVVIGLLARFYHYTKNKNER